MDSHPRILIAVGPNPDVAHSLDQAATRSGAQPSFAVHPVDWPTAVHRAQPDAILLADLPLQSNLEAAAHAAPGTPIFLIAPLMDAHEAIRAVKAGARDIITLPAQHPDLPAALASAMAGSKSAKRSGGRPARNGPAPLFHAGKSFRELMTGHVRELERRLLEEALRHTGGNKAEAARILELDYKTVHTKCKQAGLSGLRRRGRIPQAAAR